MTFLSFLNTVILLGAMQGFIVSAVLFRGAGRNLRPKLLACLLFIIALACLKIYLDSVSFLSSGIGPFIDALVPFFIIMPVGPLIYFYCKSVVQPESGMQRKDWIHFLPVVIDVFHHVSALVFIFLVLLGFVNPQQNSFGAWFDTYNVYSDVPRWISLTVYLVLSYPIVKNQNKEVGPHTAWLKEFLWVFILFDFIWLSHLVPYVIPEYTDYILGTVGWYPVYIPLVAIVYWLGIRALRIGVKEMSKKQGALKLPDPQINELMDKINRAMSADKLYLDVDLTLAKLAEHIDASPKIVSAVLNQRTGKGFNDYVNRFRIEEVKARLSDGDHKKYTITAVAYDCGFNSQPTFQRAFKSHVGLTPREFLLRKGNLTEISAGTGENTIQKRI